MRGLVSYLLVPRNPSWDFEAVRGNPVRLRNCPAAVNGNEITIDAIPSGTTAIKHWASAPGSGDVGLVDDETPMSPKTCQRVIAPGATTMTWSPRGGRRRMSIQSGAGV